MKVALLGFGTVGVGVWEMLGAAAGLEQGLVLVRPGKVDAPWKTDSPDAILADESIGAVVEVMGGVDPAYDYACRVLESGRHFVTANKMLVAAHAPELMTLAVEKGVAFLFSAACGGGVPFLHNMNCAIRGGDTLRSFGGILNGTTNFMLDAMQRIGGSYGEALAEAQRLGYAEADPTADVSGLDALRKVLLGCAVSCGKLPAEGAQCEGIESFTAADVQRLKSLGLTCRLVGRGGCTEDGSIYALVEPALFPLSAPECSVLENNNLAWYRGDRAGRITLMGQGAGRYPTASAVLRDLGGVLVGERSMLPLGCERVSADNAALQSSYYVRCAAGSEGGLDIAKRFDAEEGVARVLTAPMSPAAILKYAQQLRAEGGEIFIAAWEDKIC